LPGGPGPGGIGFSPDRDQRYWIKRHATAPNLAQNIGQEVKRNLRGAQIHANRPSNIDPPIRSREFKACNVAPVATSDAAFVTITSARVPGGMNGVIVGIGQEMEAAPAFDETAWRVLVAGTPAPGFSNILCQIGTLTSPARVNIKAQENQLVEVQAISTVAGAVHFARAYIDGWTFSPPFYIGLESPDGWIGE